MADWITVKEAAARLGYSSDYFRRLFCDPSHPLVTIRHRGPGAATLVLKVEIDYLVESQTRRPAS